MKARFRHLRDDGARATRVLSNAPGRRRDRAARRRPQDGGASRETPPLSTYLLALAVGELEALGAGALRRDRDPRLARAGQGRAHRASRSRPRASRWRGSSVLRPALSRTRSSIWSRCPTSRPARWRTRAPSSSARRCCSLDPATRDARRAEARGRGDRHELAHMWYGDLVTMAWWDDLWLNEAFATWMAFRSSTTGSPSGGCGSDFQHDRAAALALDALASTHPIYAKCAAPAEATENFDLITYEKGASVVRMIERYLGAEVFRAGVRQLHPRHQESNAVAADLWSALARGVGRRRRADRARLDRAAGLPVVALARVARGGTQLAALSAGALPAESRTSPRRMPRSAGRSRGWAASGSAVGSRTMRSY